jgi:hypothetical protein
LIELVNDVELQNDLENYHDEEHVGENNTDFFSRLLELWFVWDSNNYGKQKTYETSINYLIKSVKLETLIKLVKWIFFNVYLVPHMLVIAFDEIQNDQSKNYHVHKTHNHFIHNENCSWAGYGKEIILLNS